MGNLAWQRQELDQATRAEDAAWKVQEGLRMKHEKLVTERTQLEELAAKIQQELHEAGKDQAPSSFKCP